MGYKTYSIEDTRIGNMDDKDNHLVLFAISLFLSDVIGNDRYDYNINGIFANKTYLTKKIFSNIKKSNDAINYEYAIKAYLNAPLLEFKAKRNINNLVDTEGNYSILIENATDEHLTELYNRMSATEQDSVPLSGINTVITIDRNIQINHTVEIFHNLIEKTNQIMSKALTAIRIVFPSDIGIFLVVGFEREVLTPQLRREFARKYQPRHTNVMPIKGIYHALENNYITASSIKEIRFILNKYDKCISKFKGLDVSIRRFNETFDKYQNDFDIERILDIGICFEAIFLNDNDDQELSFRLRLRVAKFLEIKYDDRNEIFQDIKKLYKYRSTIAHGGKIKPSNINEVKALIDKSLKLLSRAYIRIFTEELEISDYPEYWKKIELS